MHQIIVSDIFGKTQALNEIAAGFAETVEIFDPYNAQVMDFKDETQAYVYFSSEVGLADYAQQLLKKLRTLSGEISLLGFSVGASAIWKIAGQTELKNVAGAKCFYGSQIRHYTDINPVFPVQAIFPSTELHFCVSQLIADLSGKKNVQIHQVTSEHGFMNRYSQNYDPVVYRQFIDALYNVPFNQPIQVNAF
ncbi:dienelactone hydrolase family protein [Paraglaciecola sp.]|uniref:dienelactone hydrolase family protein n=1 Tax=Paraglaciecola sp. TaxID=1920173 RepID=UPI0030F3875D